VTPGKDPEEMPGLIRAFLCPGPGPDHTRVRTSSQKYIPDRKSPQKYTQLDAPGRTRTQKLWGGGSVCRVMQINS